MLAGRTTPLIVTLILLVATVGSAPAATSSQKWRPIRPEAPAQRLQLKNFDPASKPADEGRTWTRVSVGDTLVFRYRGSGQFRLDARPVLEDEAEEATLRYGLRFGHEPPRRFRRHSTFGGNYRIAPLSPSSTISDAVLLGDLDRNTIELSPDQQTIYFFLRKKGAKEALVRGLVRGEVERLNIAYRDGKKSSGGEWSFDAALGGAGYTSNVYLAPKNGVAASGAGFWPAEVDLRYRNRESLPFRFTADYSFDGRFYNDPILDERRHSVQLEQEWDFGRALGMRNVQFTLSERMKTKDDTFFGRGATDEFETSGLNGRVPFGNRFDYTEWTGEGALAFRTAENFEVTTTFRARRRDYDNDYSDDPTIYSLDQNRFEIGTRLAWELSKSTTLSLDASMEAQNYDEKFSRDLQGVNVVTEPTRLRRWPIEVGLRYRPRLGFQARASLGLLVTQDLYQGYWDRTSSIYRAELGWKFTRRNRINAWVRGSSTSYDSARVGYLLTNSLGVTNPIRDKSSLRLGIEGEYGLYRNADLVLSYSYENLDNNSPLFAYQRSEVLGGIVVKY